MFSKKEIKENLDYYIKSKENTLTAFSYCIVDYEDLKEEYKNECNIDESICLYGEDWIEFCEDGFYPNEWFYDEIMENEFMENFQYDYYLITNYNANWRGSKAFKITNNKDDIFTRDYDATICITGYSKGLKTITATEYSHDVPCGGGLYIIGLTWKEYIKLTEADYFDEDNYIKMVFDFADKHIKYEYFKTA